MELIYDIFEKEYGVMYFLAFSIPIMILLLLIKRIVTAKKFKGEKDNEKKIIIPIKFVFISMLILLIVISTSFYISRNIYENNCINNFKNEKITFAKNYKFLSNEGHEYQKHKLYYYNEGDKDNFIEYANLYTETLKLQIKLLDSLKIFMNENKYLGKFIDTNIYNNFFKIGYKMLDLELIDEEIRLRTIKDKKTLYGYYTLVLHYLELLEIQKEFSKSYYEIFLEKIEYNRIDIWKVL